MITPIKVCRKIFDRQYRSIVSIGRKANGLKAKELPAKLGRSKIGEFCDAVGGGGIQLLVQLGSTQVSLEHTEPIIMLLLCSIDLAELGLEHAEVMLCVEQAILAVRHHLTD